MRPASLMLAFLLVLMPVMASAQRSSVGSDFPIYDNGGKPDLTIDPKRFVSQMEIIDRYFDPIADQCVFDEFAVGAPGWRRLLRFDTVLINGGDGDLVVGDRSDPDNPYADAFYFAACHGHYHIRDFSIYEMWDANGNYVAGEKQGFCFEDSFKYGSTPSAGYNCEHQGITSGWGDWYYKQLAGQWIDITGLPEGDYFVSATINKTGLFDEGEDRYPNVIVVKVHIPDPRNKVDGSWHK